MSMQAGLGAGPRFRVYCERHRTWHDAHADCARPAPVRSVGWAQLRDRPSAAELRALDGETVAMTGYMAPFQREAAYSYFMFAEVPPGCLCCRPAADAVIEVFARRPLPFAAMPLTLMGRLRVLPADDSCGFRYQMTEAEPTDQAPFLADAAAAMERLIDSSVHDGRWLPGETSALAAPPAPRPSLSRRAVLAGGTALAGAALLPGVPGAARAQGSMDVRVGAVIAKVAAVDLHSHAGGRVSNLGIVPFDVAARMRAGRFGVVTLAFIADNPVLRRRDDGRVAAFRDPRPGELWTLAQSEFPKVQAMISEQGFVRVLSPADVEAARAADRPGLIIAAEGADFLEGDLSRLAWAHAQGLRHLQLVHYRVNELGDIMTERPRHGGLTEFGAKAIAECNRLGIVVDVAHGSAELIAQAARASRTPVVFSHGMVSLRPGQRERSRALSREQAKPIADAGGVIGIWPFGYAFGNMEEYATYIARVVGTLGADHVAIGTDMEGGIEEVFRSYAEYPRLIDWLLKKGLSSDAVAKVAGGNHARVFRAVTAAAT